MKNTIVAKKQNTLKAKFDRAISNFKENVFGTPIGKEEIKTGKEINCIRIAETERKIKELTGTLLRLEDTLELTERNIKTYESKLQFSNNREYYDVKSNFSKVRDNTLVDISMTKEKLYDLYCDLGMYKKMDRAFNKNVIIYAVK